MSLFSKLFGGGSSKAAEPEIYQGFRIFVDPVKEGGGYRVAARIEKEIDGAVKTHRLVRADTATSHETACEITLRKARQVIDEQGEGIFR